MRKHRPNQSPIERTGKAVRPTDLGHGVIGVDREGRPIYAGGKAARSMQLRKARTRPELPPAG